MILHACLTPLLTPDQAAIVGVFLGGIFWVPLTAAANRWRWRLYWAVYWYLRRRHYRRANRVGCYAQPGRLAAGRWDPPGQFQRVR